MTFGSALIYSLLGIGVVFLALVLLMVIIKILTAVSGAVGEDSAGAPEAPAPAPGKSAPPAPGSAGEVKLYDTDPRTAAMLMAIVADELKAPLNELRFMSIREIKEND